MMITAFLTLLLSVFTTPAWATSLAISEAVINWSGFSYTISEGLTVREFTPETIAASSLAVAYGRRPEDHFGDGFAFSSSDPLHSESSASVFNGVLTSRSTADGLGKGLARAITATRGRLYGSGQGVLTVSAPYSLHVSASEPGLSALASAAFLILSGRTESVVTKQLIWDSPFAGELTEYGVLTTSLMFDEPFVGPLVSIYAVIHTQTNGMTFRDLPEPSSLWLLACGVVGLVGMAWRMRLV